KSSSPAQARGRRSRGESKPRSAKAPTRSRSVHDAETMNQLDRRASFTSIAGAIDRLDGDEARILEGMHERGLPFEIDESTFALGDEIMDARGAHRGFGRCLADIDEIGERIPSRVIVPVALELDDELARERVVEAHALGNSAASMLLVKPKIACLDE